LNEPLAQGPGGDPGVHGGRKKKNHRGRCRYGDPQKARVRL